MPARAVYPHWRGRPRRRPPSGWSYVGPVDPATGRVVPVGYGENTRAYSWGYLAALCLGRGLVDYRIAVAYIEYKNVTSPSDAVSTPSTTRADTIAYYDGLAGSPASDVLRVPLVVTPALEVIPGYEAYFGPGEGNQLVVFAQTTGTAGVFGKPFGAGSNSKVYGVGLAAAPVPADRTRDILFARHYYAAGDQVLKSASGPIGIEYRVPFG